MLQTHFRKSVLLFEEALVKVSWSLTSRSPHRIIRLLSKTVLSLPSNELQERQACGEEVHEVSIWMHGSGMEPTLGLASF